MSCLSFFNFTLPALGAQLKMPPLAGSADALFIVETLRKIKDSGQRRLLAVLCNEAADIERLRGEILWMMGQGEHGDESRHAPHDAALLSSEEQDKQDFCEVLPDWETLPYDRFSPHRELIASRIRALDRIVNYKSSACQVVLISLTSALTRLNDHQYFLGHSFRLHTKMTFNLEDFRHRLVQAGYQSVSQVLSPGEWSVRGGIIDLFPMGAATPCRIELDDNRIESLRLFDPETQRTIHAIHHLELLPAREFPFDEEAINRFRGRFRDRFAVNYSQNPLYKSVSQGSLFAGAEYYLPMFVDKTAMLTDYLPDDTVLILHGGVNSNTHDFTDAFWLSVQSAYAQHQGDHERPIVPPDEMFVPPQEFRNHLSRFARITVSVAASPSLETQQVSPVDDNKYATILPLPLMPMKPMEWLLHFLKENPNPTILCAESAGRMVVLGELLDHAKIAYRTDLWGQVNHGKAGDASDINSALFHHLGDINDKPRLWLTVSPLNKGFIAYSIENATTPTIPLSWLCENDLFGISTRSPRASKDKRTRMGQRIEHWIRDLSELSIGDLVVHQQYGIGRYHGLIHLDMGDGDTEFLQLEYANHAKLYVPVTQLQVVGRFSAADTETVKLHALGNNEWEKAKQKAAKQAQDTAAELLSLYALRQAKPGLAFRVDPEAMDEFAAGFGFELTSDQELAIQAVTNDMAGIGFMGWTAQSGAQKTSSPINAKQHKASTKQDINNLPTKKTAQASTPVLTKHTPMDRLICGDVGFGKTEVAMRAAFIALSYGHQVAVLCPTTLLAEQHTALFRDRFAYLPYRIAGLSRFRTAAEQKQALSDMAAGHVDLIIGTHRLLQKDVKFRNLGLIIIDEEHRFGVRHKEALKTMRTEAHVLTMTATPIPRTLSMSLEGMRDFSVMATPPHRRLAVRTILGHFYASQVQEAVYREFRRGGQVFFLHNEVSTIAAIEKQLRDMVPEARIAIAHGQMEERQLERVMRDFRHQHFNILLCTTIIETGIDIPNANTILINRADRFGIAQLHQLRGRVGRSHHQAYCYLLIEDEKKLTKPARQRLEAICASEELGAGFYLAMHDLEIRGAGEFLGENQSGSVEQVGFDLYAQMLQQAVTALKKGEKTDSLDLTRPFSQPDEVNLHTSALLPADYCHDVHERLKIYKRLSLCEHEDAITDIRIELVDRFGLLPPAAEMLLTIHRLRIEAASLGIYKIDANAQNIQMCFGDKTPVTPIHIIGLLQKNRNWSLLQEKQGGKAEREHHNRLVIQYPSTQPIERVQKVYEVLRQLRG